MQIASEVKATRDKQLTVREDLRSKREESQGQSDAKLPEASDFSG